MHVSAPEGCGEDGADTCQAAGCKDAQQRCQADAAGDGARLQQGVVVEGQAKGAGSVHSSHPEGEVEGCTDRAGHTSSCSFSCEHFKDGNGKHEGTRRDAMGTCHDNA